MTPSSYYVFTNPRDNELNTQCLGKLDNVSLHFIQIKLIDYAILVIDQSVRFVVLSDI